MSEILRYEIKMVCEAHMLGQVRSWVRMHPACLREAYPLRQINNIYFDTPDRSSYWGNMMGVGERRKIRLRWYGEDYSQATKPVLELKYKKNQLGGKQNIKLKDTVLDLQRPWVDIMAELTGLIAPHGWFGQVFHEVQIPLLINSYHREYFVTPDEKVRVTLDFNIKLFDQRVGSRPNWERPLPYYPYMAIEIKADQGYEEELQAVSTLFPLRWSRHSKYVMGVLGGFEAV
ncbi:MAG: polyphosphate polymerase domain-containing protein [Chloroflexi bacterium]|nr:polyphosphate polymerase domain-containing protein [Chloroflexota bacterium]MDA0242691.1 polyphosphate polymerase domain-containing protein [Chloroflexota bacterium]